MTKLACNVTHCPLEQGWGDQIPIGAIRFVFFKWDLPKLINVLVILAQMFRKICVQYGGVRQMCNPGQGPLIVRHLQNVLATSNK